MYSSDPILQEANKKGYDSIFDFYSLAIDKIKKQNKDLIIENSKLRGKTYRDNKIISDLKNKINDQEHYKPFIPKKKFKCCIIC